jgi:hypothetical protein
MGFLTGLLSGSKGSDFQAQQANILQPFTAQDVQGQNAAAQQALAQQQAFVNALQTGQGLQGGAANLQNTYGALGNVAAGTGPNPAQAMLANTTGANVANTAALIAGQRGAGANPGLAARNAAIAGAGIQQNAAGQGAALQAQQSLNALGQQGQIAGQQAGMQQSAIQGLTGAQQQQQNLIQNQVQEQNTANVAATSNQNNANAAIAQGNQKAQQGLGGGLLNAAGGILGLAEGGQVPGGPQSHFGKTMHAASGSSITMKRGGEVPGTAKVSGDSPKNDIVDAKLSPGEIVIPRSVANAKDAPKKAAEFVAAVLAGRK